MNKSIMLIITFSLFTWVHILSAQDVSIQFQSNKAEYICGEPVLLKTTITNPSKENITDKWHGYSWGRDSGFTMFVALGDENFQNVLNIEAKLKLEIGTPPLQWDLFQDRHWLPRNLSTGQIAERLDMLIFPKPGDYKLKAVLQEDGTKYESEPIEFRLLNINEREDSLSKLGNQDFLINLGFSISSAHYAERFLGNLPEEFELAAPLVKDGFRDSAFRESILYADILTHYNPRVSTHELIEGRKELALRFQKEYPNSWLLTEIYRKLFNTYIAEKDVDKAEEYLDKAIEKAPNATVLRYVRDNGPNILNEIRQESGQAEQPLAKKPVGLALPVTAVAIAGALVIGLILIFRKKPQSGAE